MVDIIISAHGGRWYSQRRNLKVPAGSSVAFYVFDGQIMPNQAGYYYLAQLQGGNVNQRAFAELYSAGQSTYDYGCWYAEEFADDCGIFQVGSGNQLASLDQYDEDNPLLLSQILKNYPNCRIHWLCCREVDVPDDARSRVSAGSFLTAARPARLKGNNIVPGASVLGMGFDAVGAFSTTSLTQQIIQQSTSDSGTWTFPPTGTTYDVPNNVSVNQDTRSSGSAQVFESEQQFQSYFSAKADISGSYGAFSAEFSSAYSQASTSNTSNYYALYEADFKGWDVMLIDQSGALLSPGFSNDPDVVNLPSTFTPDNQESFFAVFRKFGTHFVTQTSAGGSFDYYLAVERSYSSNITQVEANVSMEYDAVFVSGSAKASTEWGELGQNWASSRTVQVSAVGGDTSTLNALIPAYGDNFATAFASWQSGVMTNPAIMGFTLRPINLLFSGAKGAAVEQALNAYLNGAIVATANADYTPGSGPGGGNYTTGSTILVAGALINPEPLDPVPSAYVYENIVYPIGGYQVAIIDQTTLEPILTYIYYQQRDFTNPDPWKVEAAVYDQIMADVAEATDTGYYVVIAGFGIDLTNYPTAAFANWLSSCGAGMQGWKQYIGFTGSPGMASYTMIGQQGMLPGTAVENFAVNTDWFDYPMAVDASSIAMLYADSPLSTASNTSRGSLVSERQEAA